MGAKRVINGVHIVPMGLANAFLIEGDDGLALIDAGFPAKEAAVFGAIDGIGRSAGQLRHLIFTHGHPDHIGSAAAIVRKTGARTYMHPLDIPIAESGGPFRPMRPAPGLLGQVLCRLFFDPEERMEPVAIDQPLTDGEILPIAGGIEVVHTPGHCAGHVALLWHPGPCCSRAMCMNLMGLGDPVGFESLDGGAREPAQTCRSFIRRCRVRPRQAYRPRCVGAVPQQVGPEIGSLTWGKPVLGRSHRCDAIEKRRRRVGARHGR